jgi:hypothetical protein
MEGTCPSTAASTRTSSLIHTPRWWCTEDASRYQVEAGSGLRDEDEEVSDAKGCDGTSHPGYPSSFAELSSMRSRPPAAARPWLSSRQPRLPAGPIPLAARGLPAVLARAGPPGVPIDRTQTPRLPTDVEQWSDYCLASPALEKSTRSRLGTTYLSAQLALLMYGCWFGQAGDEGRRVPKLLVGRSVAMAE